MTLSCSSQDRIIKQRYTSLADLEDDLTLLWENARTYNEESSQVRGVVMWVELVHVTYMCFPTDIFRLVCVGERVSICQS